MLLKHVVLPQFLHNLYPVLKGHLEVQNYEAERLHDAAAVGGRNCLLNFGFARFDSHSTIVAVARISNPKLFQGLLHNVQRDVGVVSNYDVAQHIVTTFITAAVVV